MSVTVAPGSRRPLFEDVHDDYRESFRRFLQAEVVPHHEEWQEAHIVSRDLFTKAAEHGFLAMAVEEEYGGSGVDDWRFNAVLAEEAAYAVVGSSWMGPNVHNDLGLPYLRAAANEEQKQRWFPGVASGEQILALAMTEPGTGSDLAGIAARAKKDGDDYIINGAKTFISNGILADLVIVVARTTPEGGARGLSLLVVERGMEGFERGRNLDKIGQKAQDTAELFFSDVRVPKENLLGGENQGFVHLMTNLAQERLQIAVSAIAAAEHLLEITTEYVKQREAFGRPLARLQHIRFEIAEMATECAVTRTFVDRCITEHNRGALDAVHASMAKWWATELEKRVADPERFGPRLSGTPKGDLRHLRPDRGAIARMDETAELGLILFPAYGFPRSS